MEAKSKFNIGDIIYYMYGEQPIKDIISGITFFVGKKKSSTGERYETMGDIPSVSYHTEESSNPINEDKAYATKGELQKSVFANIQ